MNKDQRLLEEAYQSIYESTREPAYFGPVREKAMLMRWLKSLKHEVHEDGSVSVHQDVMLNDKKLTRIPFNFRSITGSFYCNSNNLTSLEGAPKKVGGSFYCSNNNNLTSLEGAPKKVGGSFYCSNNNNLTSLEGAPEEVGGHFYCNYNNLTSLEGAPIEVGGDFYCNRNNLTSLEGAPEVIKGEFKSNQFSDADYRAFAKMRKYVDGKLDKDLDIDLEDFS